MVTRPHAYEAPPPRNEFPRDRADPRKAPEDRDKGRGRLLLWQDEFRADRDCSDKWRRLCPEWFSFIDGRQWTQADLQLLMEQKRVPVTINLSKPIITMVRGQELQNREDIIAFAREFGDAHISEVATAALDYVRDQCNGAYVWSEAFSHMLICGMGWVGTRIDYDEDQDGKLIDEVLDPMTMYWDYAATARNLADARRLWQVQILDVDAARELLDQDLPANELDAAWTRVPVPGTLSRADRSQRDYRGNKSDHNPGLVQVRLVERQWSELRDIVMVQDPRDNSVLELDPGDVKKFGVQGLVMGQRKKRVWRKAIVGRDILHEEDLGTDSFHFQCMTAIRDMEEGHWYGMTPSIMDPQRWANNFLAQTIHIYKTMGKGGVLFETGAFADPDRATADWSKATAKIELNPGKLASATPAVQEKPSGQLPAGIINMVPMLIDMIRQAAGVNPEMLGMTAGTQAAAQDPSGVLELQRKEAGMTMLAEYFDAMSLFRRMHGRLHLDLICEFLMSEERLIRIVGDEGAQYVPMLLDGNAKDYDLITEGVPTSPTQRMRNWTILQPILPMLAQLPEVPPEIWVEVAKISPLPPQFAEKMAEVLTKKNPSPEEMQKQQQEEEMRIRAIMAQIMKDEEQAKNFSAQAELNMAKAQATGEEIQLKALDGIVATAQGMMPEQAPRMDPNKAADRDFQGRQSEAERQFKGGQADRDRAFKGQESARDRNFKGFESREERSFKGGQADRDRSAKAQEGMLSRAATARQGAFTRAASASEGRANRVSKSNDMAAERRSREIQATRQGFADIVKSNEDRAAKLTDARENRDFQREDNAAERKARASEGRAQRSLQREEGRETRDMTMKENQRNRYAQAQEGDKERKARAQETRMKASAAKAKPAAKKPRRKKR